MDKPTSPYPRVCRKSGKERRTFARLSERDQLLEALAQVILSLWEGLDHVRRLRVLLGEPIGPTD